MKFVDSKYREIHPSTLERGTKVLQRKTYKAVKRCIELIRKKNQSCPDLQWAGIPSKSVYSNSKIDMKSQTLTFCSPGDICNPNPCENGGICLSGLADGSFSCECPEGFTDPNCSSVVEVGKCKISASLSSSWLFVTWLTDVTLVGWSAFVRLYWMYWTS